MGIPAMVRCLLLAALLVVAVTSVPLEGPLQDADDMINHLDMDTPPEERRLGEGRSVQDDDDSESDLFAIPSDDDAMKEMHQRKDRENHMMEDLGKTLEVPTDELLLGKSLHESDEQQGEEKTAQSQDEQDA